ncbi:MAG: VOC family protein [Myxococcales bacterium]|nr:MAG: VOC family protein [Myxococcales bacterium]
MAYTGFNHLAMVTGDMEGTVRYWRDLIGLRLVAAIGQPGYRHYFFEITPGDRLAFFEWPGVVPAPDKDHGRPVKGPVVFDHVAIGVDGPETLWALRDRLLAAGFWVSEAVDHGFIHSIYSFDPNGLPVEFSYDVPERDVGKSPMLADPELVAAAKEGPEPQPGKWPAVKFPTPLKARRVYPGAGSEIFHGRKG